MEKIMSRSNFNKSSSMKTLKPSSASFVESNTLKRSPGSSGNLAVSFPGPGSTGKGKSLKNSTDLQKIETEYIRNLQQQVYFLELEANFLREQARRATEMHPQMTAEAEKMLNKLRHMQAERDGLTEELKRVNANLDLANLERDRLINKCHADEEAFQREKKVMMEELVLLRKDKDQLERELQRREALLKVTQEDVEKSMLAVQNTETKIQMLKSQLDQRTEQHRLSQQLLEEKRTELLKTETQLRELEDKYYASSSMVNDKLTQDLRDEVRLMRQKVKEAELRAEQDRLLRTKVSEDSSHLVKENALLGQQVNELRKQLERERSVREGMDTRRSQNITELVVLREQEKQLKFDLDHSRELLLREQERVKVLMQQLAKQEHFNTSAELSANTTRSRLNELEGVHQSTDAENTNLRRDKMLLVDHVSNLQKQLDDRETENVRLQAHIHSLQTRLQEVEYATIDGQKQDELRQIADSLKHLSSTMKRTIDSPRPTKTLDYD